MVRKNRLWMITNYVDYKLQSLNNSQSRLSQYYYLIKKCTKFFTLNVGRSTYNVVTVFVNNYRNNILFFYKLKFHFHIIQEPQSHRKRESGSHGGWD